MLISAVTRRVQVDVYNGDITVVMAALGHYVFVHEVSFFFFLLSFFSSPNLSRRMDVYHTSTHGVALVRI